MGYGQPRFLPWLKHLLLDARTTAQLEKSPETVWSFSSDREAVEIILSSDEGSPPREGRAKTRSFDPYGPLKSTTEINNGIKDLLLRYTGSDEGYVYGFKHPDDVALNPSPGGHSGIQLIKIGRSKNHQVRMRQIRKKCRYVPHTVFAHRMPHHVRIERIIHMQLHNSRLRDVGCTGCGARHEEWFRVEDGYAEHLVMLWKAFAESHPYDEQGAMLPMWRERLEQLDLDDADCWQHFIHEDVPSGQPCEASPRELEAQTAPARLVDDQINSSSDGVTGADGQKIWELV
ncbi:hypothetical protein J7T55_001134 [Diaporthe amygdali]|uniref:uncharacterized protein n=1 Tax=Phomopsis amygdali TaxID=1214568 RepID=UPI0022FE303D|nr:uncharacterized protein J7T55_001134 [Diaporthe amygdali]KAJ0120277.1 hypothetical protein J7T55_001134 [Diaporthe amygdali]